MTAESIGPAATSERVKRRSPNRRALTKGIVKLELLSESRGLLAPLAGKFSDEQVTMNTIKQSAVDIKDIFQPLASKLTADERDDTRRYLRAKSVCLLFNNFGMLENTESVNSDFKKRYHATEAAIPQISRDQISNIADKYEDHPTVRTLTLASSISNNTIPKDDIVFMRRTAMVLMHESQI